MKLSDGESEQWSTEVSIVYSERKQLSRVSEEVFHLTSYLIFFLLEMGISGLPVLIPGGGGVTMFAHKNPLS